MIDAVRIGPHPFWRWAVAPSSGTGNPGCGFWSRRAAETFHAEVCEALPMLPSPLLLRRRGLRGFEIVEG